MPAAPMPVDENERMAALAKTGLLQRRPSKKIQVLTELTASMLQRPSAALSLVTADRQVSRPAVGGALASTPRSMSFCAYAILQPDRPLIVPDPRLDKRFVDNALVTGPTGLRFYAGIPVKVPNGQPIGALCVLDTEPGSLSAAQVQTLKDLAHEIEREIAEHHPTLHGRHSLLHELRQAIQHSTFRLHWQPIAESDTLHTVGHEALIRWTRDDGTNMAPDEFIPVAESAGLIGRIDRFVLQAACTALADHTGPRRVSVNVSAGWFNRSRAALPGVIEGVLGRTGLSPDRLVIEVTERMLVADPERALRDMRALGALGVRMALDDFGTGYSSLSYLEAFPFQTVKLDKSFVRGLGCNARAEAVARAVIRLGHDLGMTICAEGVELPRQLDFLRQAGCDQVQGYLVGQPGPIGKPSSSFLKERTKERLSI